MIGSPTAAQDMLSYGFDGRIGVGYLSQTTADRRSNGFQYEGPVLSAEGIGRIELQPTEELSFGATARVSWQKRSQTNYDLLTGGVVGPGGGSDFGKTELDVAVYAALSVVTVSYGEMETAFDFATLEVGQGSSILDGGDAVWMNLGDGSGSEADRGARIASPGPARRVDFRTARVDVSLGDFTLSASKSKPASGFGDGFEAAGLVWNHDFAGTEVFLGAGYDRGASDKFKSFSLGVTSGGLNVVLSRIQRTPLVIRSFDDAAFDIRYSGESVSYDFGALTLGIARSRQAPLAQSLFQGTGQAVWASWEARENVTVDVEWSKNEYLGGGDNTEKASFAVTMNF